MFLLLSLFLLLFIFVLIQMPALRHFCREISFIEKQREYFCSLLAAGEMKAMVCQDGFLDDG
jgi:hypothetical protein